MFGKDEVIELIYDAIDVINDRLEVKLKKSSETSLYGKKSKIDSIGLVSLIVAIEELLEEKTNMVVAIADERALSLQHSPFRTVGTLADYIIMVIEENANE